MTEEEETAMITQAELQMDPTMMVTLMVVLEETSVRTIVDHRVTIRLLPLTAEEVEVEIQEGEEVVPVQV
jgi:hypothetical protein